MRKSHLCLACSVSSRRFPLRSARHREVFLEIRKCFSTCFSLTSKSFQPSAIERSAATDFYFFREKRFFKTPSTDININSWELRVLFELNLKHHLGYERPKCMSVSCQMHKQQYWLVRPVVLWDLLALFIWQGGEGMPSEILHRQGRKIDANKKCVRSKFNTNATKTPHICCLVWKI